MLVVFVAKYKVNVKTEDGNKQMQFSLTPAITCKFKIKK